MSKIKLTGTELSSSLNSTGSFGRADISSINIDVNSGQGQIGMSSDAQRLFLWGGSNRAAGNGAYIQMDGTNLGGNLNLFAGGATGSVQVLGNLSGSLGQTGSFSAIFVESAENGTTIQSDEFGLRINSTQGWYGLQVESAYENALRVRSTDSTGGIDIGDNNSTNNYNRIQVVGNDRMEFYVNNVEMVELQTGEITINNSGANINTRIEGDNDENLLFIDAGKDAIGIGKPMNNGDEKFYVGGDVGITGSLHVSGNISTSGSIIAKEFRTEFVNQIIATSSGSTEFGDDTGDVHRFTGSLNISASTGASQLVVGTGNVARYISVSEERALFGYDGTAAVVQGGAGSKGLKLGVNNATLGSNTKFFISASGNEVGIHTTSPRNGLDVASNTHFGNSISHTHKFTGSLEVSGTLNIPTGSITVEGGVGGANIARFSRNQGTARTDIDIHAGSGDPQLTFSSPSGRDYSIGQDISENHFAISEHTAVGTNDRLIIRDDGDVFISQSLDFGAYHATDKIVMYKDGNEKIGTAANTLVFTADNFDFRDTAGHDNLQIGSGEVVVNEDSEDVDFRVESNASTHLLFCNGGTSRVGIGTGSPGSLLEVHGDISSSITSTGSFGAIHLPADAKIGFGTTTPAQAIDLRNGRIIMNNNYGYVQRDAAGNSATLMNQDGSDILTIGDANHTEQLKIRGANEGGGNGYIHLKSDGGVGITGNSEFSSPMTVNYGATFNEGGNDSDTRIEGSSDANLFRVDAGNDRVGIGTGTPGTKLEVIGSISGSLTSTGSFGALVIDPLHKGFTIGNHNNKARLIYNAGYFQFTDADNSYGGIAAESGSFYGDVGIRATKKLYFDDGEPPVAGHTYIHESAADTMDIVVGGQQMLQLVEGSTDYIRTPNNVLLGVGGAIDLYMNHNGTNSFLQNTTGQLIIKNTDTNEDIFIQGDDGGNIITAIQIDVSESGSILLPNDLQYLKLGTGGDGVLYSYQDNFYVSNFTAGKDTVMQYLKSDGSAYVSAITIDASAERVVFGAVDVSIPVAQKLYFGGGDHTYISEDADDRLRFFTGGAEFMRFTEASDNSLNIYEDVYVSDDKKIHFGAGNDIKIYHNGGGNSNFENHSGDLYFTQYTNDGDIYFRTDDGSGGVAEYLRFDGGAESIEIAKSVNMTGTGVHTINTSNDVPLRVKSTDGTSAISIGDNSSGAETHNRIQVTGDVMELIAANSKRVELSSGAIVFNQDSDDVDFRVESNGSTHMLFIDGNLDRMGVGTDFGTGGAANELKTLLTLKPKGTCNTTTLSAAVSGGLSLNAGAGLDDNDFYPAISFMHDDGNTSTQNRTTAIIVARATETYDDGNDCGTELEFYTKPKNTNGLPDLNMILEDDGDLHVEGDVVAFSTTTSDKKLKDNVVNIENPLDKITKLRGVEFDWNATSRKGQHDIGLIAQEVEKVIPDVVREKPLKTGDFANNEKTYKTVDYEKIVAVLVESTKEQQKQIEDLKKEIKELKK